MLCRASPARVQGSPALPAWLIAIAPAAGMARGCPGTGGAQTSDRHTWPARRCGWMRASAPWTAVPGSWTRGGRRGAGDYTFAGCAGRAGRRRAGASPLRPPPHGRGQVSTASKEPARWRPPPPPESIVIYPDPARNLWRHSLTGPDRRFVRSSPPARIRHTRPGRPSRRKHARYMSPVTVRLAYGDGAGDPAEPGGTPPLLGGMLSWHGCVAHTVAALLPPGGGTTRRRPAGASSTW